MDIRGYPFDSWIWMDMDEASLTHGWIWMDGPQVDLDTDGYGYVFLYGLDWIG